MAAKLVNFLLFQVVWFACVLGAAHDEFALGIVIALAALGASWWLSSSRRRDAWLALALAAGGFGLDSLEVALGVYTAPGARLAPWATPWWFVLLWAGFATTLCSSFEWSLARPKLAIALGAVAGPCAYVAGERLGALTLGEPRFRALAVLAVAWALALAGAITLARRWDARFRGARPANARAAP